MATLFSDDCETGSLTDNWNFQVGSGTTYTTTRPRTGSKSIEENGTPNIELRTDALATGVSEIIGYFYDDGNTTGTSEFYIVTDTDNPGTCGVGVRLASSTTEYVTLEPGVGWATTGASRSVGWHKVEIRVNGTSIELYLNDTLEKTVTTISMDSKYIGLRLYATSTAAIYFDDIIATDGQSDPMIDMGGLYVYLLW